MRQPVTHGRFLVHRYLQLNGPCHRSCHLLSSNPLLPQEFRHSQHLPNPDETPPCIGARCTRTNQNLSIRVSRISNRHTQFCLSHRPPRYYILEAIIQMTAVKVMCKPFPGVASSQAWDAPRRSSAPVTPYRATFQLNLMIYWSASYFAEDESARIFPPQRLEFLLVVVCGVFCCGRCYRGQRPWSLHR